MAPENLGYSFGLTTGDGLFWLGLFLCIGIGLILVPLWMSIGEWFTEKIRVSRILYPPDPTKSIGYRFKKLLQRLKGGRKGEM